jgi:hypothetical protein
MYAQNAMMSHRKLRIINNGKIQFIQIQFLKVAQLLTVLDSEQPTIVTVVMMEKLSFSILKISKDRLTLL